MIKAEISLTEVGNGPSMACRPMPRLLGLGFAAVISAGCWAIIIFTAARSL